MLFHTIDFAVFFPIVFCLYWLLGSCNLKFQNLFIVFSSYIFYGWWDWRFLFLIFFSSAIDYFVGIQLEGQRNQTKRKIALCISLFVNLGFLFFFKYFNFFLENFSIAFSFLGQKIETTTLSITLPVGISFYTFQTLSYSIDVYQKKLEPTNDFTAFLAYVSFFPQLVAGPIERATNLLPQFLVERQFSYSEAVNGSKQMLWGFFKKMVIADNCAYYANLVFSNPHEFNSSALMLGAFFFAFQIYCDFSGYSDIAIGISRLFGFKLMRNFAYPYFSRNIPEFWRRWHISLSTWFRDYLYIPLGGSKYGMINQLKNTLILFAVSGFWHGANWTFVFWGVLNALFMVPSIVMNKNKNHLEILAKSQPVPGLKDLRNILLTFLLTTITWIFFRSRSLNQAIDYIFGLFSPPFLSMPNFFGKWMALKTILLIITLLIVEWTGREQQYAIEKIGITWPRPFRWFFYYLVIIFIFAFAGRQQEFIYFQF